MQKATENQVFVKALSDLLDKHGYAKEIETESFPAAMMMADHLDAMRTCAHTMRNVIDKELSRFKQ